MVMFMNSAYLFKKHLLRRGCRESDQNKRTIRSRFAALIGGAGFSCRIGVKICAEKSGA